MSRARAPPWHAGRGIGSSRAEGRVDTFECKIDPDEVSPAPVAAFRRRYPLGRDYIVVPVVKRAYRIRRGGREFTVCGTSWRSRVSAGIRVGGE